MQSNELLVELDSRRARARARASAGWLPLFLTGLALLGAFPAYAGWWEGPAGGCVCSLTSAHASLWARLDGRIADLGGGNRPLALYWLAVVPAVYALSACWFARTARQTGMRQRWGVHLLIGLAALVGLLLTVLPPVDGWIPASSRPALTPLLALAVGQLALGRVERDRVLVAAGVAVAGVAVAVAAFRQHASSLPDSGWGNVGQALQAASVEVGLLGLALVVGSLFLHAVRRRATRAPIIALSAEPV